MDSGKFIDFNGDSPNTVWVIERVDGVLSFHQKTLQHAVAGDSDSIYCKPPPSVISGLERADFIEFAQQVCSHVNDEFPKFIMDAFNCPQDRADSMQSEMEVVADKSLFFNKKRYAMRKVYDEGKLLDGTVDDIKIMGLEIKKSDTSEVEKHILKSIIVKIFEGITMEDLLEEINSWKEEFMELPFDKICKPMSCKTLVGAQEYFETTGSMKGLHYSARAALFYNMLCSDSDRRVYAGEKVGLLYIKHPKSKYIAYPLDAEQLPQWMKDIVIDYKTMWDKTQKKIINYIRSVGWDKQSRTKSKRASFYTVTGGTK